ncbi:MAG: recombinase family protein [Chloroflexota bacterium]|nr:recombinase family protein [Chloroflexota bacterium]
MMPANAEKINSHHLERRAYIYVRQSSPGQVRHKLESQHNQYALTERAMTLGWSPERIHVIDSDLGQSGQDPNRPGFQELVSEVSLGRVGIVLAYEASRLARNNSDWYRLLDMATVVGTLIADTDGVYDPRSYNDRLLLGLRGIMSEAELHLLQLRLKAGRMRQIERGTYRQSLPTGLVRLEDGRVVKDPDQQIQRSIELVLERFSTLGTCQQVLRSLREDGLLLPRRQVAGLHAGELLWKRPSEAAVYDIVCNAAYAGAFVYGRKGTDHDGPGGKAHHARRPVEEWTAIHHGVYPAYISWEQYMANRAKLADNASAFDRQARGATRQGDALLAGLAVCGRCGHQMRVAYKSHHRYVCNALNETHREPMCLSLDGMSVDSAVVEAFFEAMEPAELDLLDEVLAAQGADHQRLAQQYTDEVRRAEYEARLAERQYRKVDPENRLVAGELERRWELALRALEKAREVADQFAQSQLPTQLDPELRAQLRDVGKRLPALWVSGKLKLAHKKELLRSLIQRVILRRPIPSEIEIRVVWISGAYSQLSVHPPLHRGSDLHNYDELVERVLELSGQGYHDAQIVRILTAEDFRSARLAHVPIQLLEKIRKQHGQRSLNARFRHEEKIDGYWTVHGLSRELGVSGTWLRRRITEGKLPAVRHPLTGCYLIESDESLLAEVRQQAAARHPQ